VFCSEDLNVRIYLDLLKNTSSLRMFSVCDSFSQIDSPRLQYLSYISVRLLSKTPKRATMSGGRTGHQVSPIPTQSFHETRHVSESLNMLKCIGCALFKHLNLCIYPDLFKYGFIPTYVPVCGSVSQRPF
jgi:hypothetical protein